MSKTINIKTESAIIAIGDAQSFGPLVATDSLSLAHKAREDGFFILDTEDPAQLRLEICVDEEPADAKIDCYEPTGGAFRVEAPTGAIRICDPATPGSGEELAVQTGTYALSPMRLRTDNLAAYKKYMKQAMGESDSQHWERVEKLQLTGCATIVLAIVLALIPPTRPFWWIYVPALLFPNFIAWALRATPRYKRIERAKKGFEASQPHLVLILRLDPNLSKNVLGGRIVFT